MGDKKFWERPRDTRGRFIRALSAPRIPTIVKTDFGKNYHTAQIYSKGFEFAFMSNIQGIYKQACTFVYCKDFLHDAVWAFVNKTKWKIYGFKYDSATHTPLDLDNCVLAFRNTQYKTKAEEFHQHRNACQEFLNGFEAACGFSPSQVLQVEHNDGPCWLIIGDKRWQHAPALVGIYTLLIRVGFMHQPNTPFTHTLQLCKDGKLKAIEYGSAGCYDAKYIRSSWKGLEAVLKYNIDCFHEKMEDNYPKDLPQKGISLHDHCGPVSWCQGSCRKAMPRWYKHL